MSDYQHLVDTKYCPMCGAVPGEACTIISGDPERGEVPGAVRSSPHAARHNDHPIPVLVKDEPGFASGVEANKEEG